MFKKLYKNFLKKIKKIKTTHTELTTIENEIRKSPNISTYYDILLLYYKRIGQTLTLRPWEGEGDKKCVTFRQI